MKKLKKTTDLKPGTTLRYYKKNFGYGILNVIHNNEHFITTLTSETVFNKLQINDELQIYLWSENRGAYEWHSKIIGKIENGSFILLNHSNKIKWQQEKKCLNLKTNLVLDFFIYNIHNSNKKHFFSTKTEIKHGKIVELTDNDAILNYNNKIEPYSILNGNIVINNEEINIIGLILDYNPLQNRYKILFSGTNDKEKRKILDYIFENYRE